MALNSFDWNVAQPGITAAMMGVNNLGRGLEQFFGQKREKQDREEEMAKQRAQETTRLVTSLDTMGILPKDVGTTKSLDELRGIRDGIVEKANLGEHVAKQQEAQLRQQQILQAIAASQQQQALQQQRGPLELQQLQQTIAAGQQQQQAHAVELPLKLQQLQQAIAVGQQQQQAGGALQSVIAGGATPGAPELSTPGVFGGPVAGAMQPGFDQGKLLAALGQNPAAATPQNLDAIGQLMRAMQTGDRAENPLAQFNADTARINAESNRKIAEARGQAGPEKPTISLAVKSPDGTTVTEHLTKAELAARRQQQNAPVIAGLQSEREQHQQALNQGDSRFGWTLGSRRERIVAIDKALAEMGAGAKAKSDIPQNYLDYLKANPDSAASFDQKYGAGAASRILGK
jgi:hypothetical protein